MSFICITVRMNLIKAHGEKGSGPFSFERLATFPPQADHVLVVFFFIHGGPGGCVKAPRQLPTLKSSSGDEGGDPLISNYFLLTRLVVSV